MTSELDGLREGWCLYRDGDQWAVGEMMDEGPWMLARAATVAEAIAEATVEAERQAQEQAERDADYQRRKAAGKLTHLELACERLNRSFAPHVLEAIETPSVISIRTVGNYEATRIEPKEVHRSEDRT